MNRPMQDPFYRQILAGLEAKDFDPKVFERCVCDLLRDDPFPSLVPIPGGNDAGMDGAIADGEGEAYPLVCTTRDDVIGNLTESLESYLRNSGRRRKVTLATSLALTPRLRRNLEERAREKGFVLTQIFEQRAIADRLFYSERWCPELLGIAWKRQALSPLPRPGRPQLEIELIGRDADVEWLRSTTGDRLITGEPGSGKTFLLRHLARDGWGVFLHGEDPTEIRNALCEKRPDLVIVDDAHDDPDRLHILRHLRQEIQQDFAIVATCWKGEQDTIAEELGSLPTDRIRRLELLTRDQIVEVFRQAGVRAHDDFLRHLVDQAANKPGLAATLAAFCLRGSWSEVLRGEALARSLVTDLRKLVGEESADFLAVLSVGGEHGMPLEVAAEFLDLGLWKARELAIRLALGGVLSEKGEWLVIRPTVLRAALLRKAFFEGPARLDYRRLLELVPSLESAVATLITAAGYGADIPQQELRDLVRQCPVPKPWRLYSGRTEHVWHLYAALGEDEAGWALANYPGDVFDIAGNALDQAPRAAIPRLLERAGEDETAAKQSLDLLRQWMQDLSAEEMRPGEIIARRKLAVRLVMLHLEGSGGRPVAVRVLFQALSPTLRSSSRDPGIGRTITTRQGLLPPEQLSELEAIWQRGRSAVSTLEDIEWDLLEGASWDWAYPESHAPGITVTTEIRDALVSLARRVLGDLAGLAGGSPGFRAGLNRLARRIGFELGLESDQLFELLYPADGRGDVGREDQQSAAAKDLRELAGRWKGERHPEEIARELLSYENEASKIRHGGLRRSPDLCRLLAESAQHPARWVEAFLERDLPADLVRPFLERMVATRSEGWQEQLVRCLEIESQAWTASRLILQLDDPPPSLLERALVRASAFPQLIETLCGRKEVPHHTLEALLDSSDQEVALAAAIGEWLADPCGQVSESVGHTWRRAILGSATIERDPVLADTGIFGHWLSQILSADPELARDWLERVVARDPELSGGFRGTVFHAVDALPESSRLLLVERLQPGHLADWLLPRLVDRKPTIYRRLLELDTLHEYQLLPLAGRPDAEWAKLAKLALEAGHEPREIARASFLGSQLLDGYCESSWLALDPAFAELANDPDEDLREVARYGRQMAREEVDRAVVRKKHHELDGI